MTVKSAGAGPVLQGGLSESEDGYVEETGSRTLIWIEGESYKVTKASA